MVITVDCDWDGSQLKHLIGPNGDACNWEKALNFLTFDVSVVKNKDATAEKTQNQFISK